MAEVGGNTLSNPREGYFRIEHAGTGSVVDIYDVENLYFSDGQGGYEYKPQLKVR